MISIDLYMITTAVRFSLCPVQCGSVGWVSSSRVRGTGLIPSGVHAWVLDWSLDGVHATHQCLSLMWVFLSLSPFLLLSLKINK